MSTAKTPSSVKVPLYWLIAVSLFANVIMSGGRVASSLFALQFKNSEMLAGFAYSAYSLLPALLSLSMGRLIDQIGPRKVMRISLLTMVASLMIPIVWQSIVAVMINAILSGLAFGAYMLSANVSVGMAQFKNPAERVGMFGWLQMGNSFSAAIGPSIVGFSIDYFGFRAAFVTLLAFVSVSLACSFQAKVPDTPRVREIPDRPPEHIITTVLEDKLLLRIFLVGMTISLSWDGFVFMAPLLGHARGYSATGIGLVLSAFAAGTFATRLMLPWLSRHISEWGMLSMAFCTSAVVFVLLPWVHSEIFYAVMGFIFGLAAGVVQPSILNLVYHNVPKGREGEGFGLRAMLGNIMGATGPSLFGAISGFLGLTPVFLLIASVMSVSGWQAWLGKKQVEEIEK